MKAGKTVIVTGASKGIGAATAQAMITAGARLIAHYGSDRAGAERATALASDGQVTLLQADFFDMDAVDTFWTEALKTAGGCIDVLVNNAGIMQQTGGIEDPIEAWADAWSKSIVVNVDAPARREGLGRARAEGGELLPPGRKAQAGRRPGQ